jgi:hypothetical protein
MPPSAPFLVTAEGDGVYKRDGPPLELIFLAVGKLAHALKVFRGAVNVEHDAGEGVA